ncbi:hypothetical protein M9H77_22548 [Catharanthus roseus]|uniref:Uncharacterized protein n=1 Tax=Catharanthus roseus TaxID=4058 RepID=A0ACC0AS93_CATRO|nr:hypothetical protein M9H77_22548 [Catharanthus roseus]
MGFTMSIEAQFPTHYNEETSESSHSNLYPMKAYGNFSPHAKTYEHNSYDCHEGDILGTRNDHNDRTYNRVPRNKVRNKGNYVNIDRRVHKKRGDYEGYYDSYSYGGYNCSRSSQTLGTTSRPLSYNNLKLPLLWDTFGSYDCVVCGENVEPLFYSYGVREEEKFCLVLKSLSYEVNVWWDRKCKNRKEWELNQSRLGA